MADTSAQAGKRSQTVDQAGWQRYVYIYICVFDLIFTLQSFQNELRRALKTSKGGPWGSLGGTLWHTGVPWRSSGRPWETLGHL